MSHDRVPPLRVALELHSTLEDLVQEASPRNRLLRDAVAREVGSVLAALGIPGEPEVETVPGPEHFLRLRVEGRLLRYPDELLRNAYAWGSGAHPRLEVTPGFLAGWLAGPAEDDGDAERRIRFLGRVCGEIVRRHPSALLGPAQVEAYRAELAREGEGDELPDSDALRGILAEVVELRISLADRAKVAGALHRAAGRRPDEQAEELIEALRADAVEIRVEPRYLRQLTLAEASTGPQRLTDLREELFVELGAPFPALRFRPDDSLPPGSFAFTVNHLPTLPVLGLRPDQVQVHVPEEHLSAEEPGVRAVPTVNPASGYPNCLVDRSLEEALAARGWTTWDPMEFLALSLAVVLRANAHCFLTRGRVRESLDRFGAAFPTLVRAADAVLEEVRLTRVLRGLLREEVSIRNLRGILERLLDLESAGEEDALRFVREGLAPAIADRFSYARGTVTAYLLDPAIEDALRSPGAGAEEREDWILEAVYGELAQLPATTQVPVLLTSGDVRRGLRAIVAPELPRVRVLAFPELPPDYNVLPVARISAPYAAPGE